MLARQIKQATLGLLLAFSTAAFAGAEDIGPGSAAPKLMVKKWLKGKPVAELEAGKTYVVEFWATWCGPCIESIPHVTEMAKKNPDVTFIGVGIWEDEEGDKIPKFVRDMGAKMDYNVGYSGNKDGMAATWMEPAAQNGIPTAFIVKDRKVMWIGHPMSMETPLAEVKAGTFDVEAFKKGFNVRAAETRKRMAADKEYSAALNLFEEGKRAEAKDALAKVVAKYPTYASSAERTHFAWLAEEDYPAWEAKTKALLETGKPENLQMVASFALSQAQKPSGATRARKAMAMVLKASTKEDYTMYLYARTVYLKLGDTKEALQATNKMIEVFGTSQYKDQPEAKEVLIKSKAELEAKLKGQ